MELTAIELRARREEIQILISKAQGVINYLNKQIYFETKNKNRDSLINEFNDQKKQWEDELRLYCLFQEANTKNLIQLLNPTLATNYAGN